MTTAGINPLVRGWCPGALRPMESGDGLIVRQRITLGIVPLALAAQIADWSIRWGNGQIDLSQRANLQLRGVSERHLPKLHAAMAKWNLLDASEAGEAIRNVISSPMAGLDPHAVLDVRPIVRDLEQHLVEDRAFHGLPAKFGFAIDDGGSFGLDDVAADIRFVACSTSAGPAFYIQLDDAAQEWLGPCQPGSLVDVADALSRVFVRCRMGTRFRRMRHLVAALGAEAIGREAGIGAVHWALPERLVQPSSYLGAHRLGSAAFAGVGLPFGRIVATDLADLVSEAAGSGADAPAELRLTPWRAVLVPSRSTAAAETFLARLSTGAFIVNPADARCRIAACPGAPSCANGTTPVHSDAAALAEALAGAPIARTILHVSGCEKGCAHARPAAVTLVARNGLYDLVRDGGASDVPVVRGLTVQQAVEQVSRIIGSA